MSDAEIIARALHGRRYHSGWIIPCPVPGHGKGRGDRNPSCTVKDGDIPGHILVHCFAGCSTLAILDFLRAHGLLDGAAPERTPSSKRRRKRSPPPAPPAEPEPDAEAVVIWKAAQSITDTPAEIYLRDVRKIEIDYSPSLRFGHAKHPVVGLELPAMIAAIARPTDRRIVAVQATFLTEDGQKCPLTVARATFGALGTGAVRLGAVDHVLGLAEGTETALSAMMLTGVPCWSAVGARLAGITIPAGIREVHIFADNDETGRKAAYLAADRYARAGRKVFVRFPPPEFNDYNDILTANAGKAAV